MEPVTIPAENQYIGSDGRKYFTYTHELSPTNKMARIERDIPIDVSAWYRCQLDTFAEYMGVHGYKKIKKCTLAQIVTQHLKFD